MTSCINEIEKLVELFNISNESNELDDDQREGNNQASSAKCSSSQSNQKITLTSKKPNPYAKIVPEKRREILDPDAEEELYFDETTPIPSDTNWKTAPKWDISYRQQVSASDVFLGMGFKNPSTSSCENMIITIDLPGENHHNIDLKIEQSRLNLVSPKFFLDVALPHPVDPKKGSAQFNKDAEKLVVNLMLDRELDVLNF